MDLEKELRDRVADRPEVGAAVLFGSHSADAARPDSDVDVGVLFSLGLGSRAKFSARLRLVAALEDLGQVDVVDLAEAPPLLAHRAISGRVLVIRDRTAWVRLVTRTLAAAGDERHWRELAAAARLRRLEEGQYGRP